MFTYEGAYASFAERTRGSITVGKEADFVVLSADPFALPVEKLSEIEALATVVKGDTVYGAANI